MPASSFPLPLSSFLVNPVSVDSLLSPVGSVATCYFASDLPHEKHSPSAIGGIVLQAAVYAGSKFTCGGMIVCCDPLNNSKMIKNINVYSKVTNSIGPHLSYSWHGG